MVIYNSPTRLAGCGFCGADDPDVAPIFPPDEQEIAIGTDPSKQQVAPMTSFDQQVAAVKSSRSWMVGLGIGVVALGVIAGVWAVSKRV